MNANTQAIVDAINEQLDRLGASDAPGEDGGLICSAPEDFPDGWVLITDAVESWQGPGWDLLGALETSQIVEGDEVENADSPGFVAAWREIGELPQYREVDRDQALQESLAWTGYVVEFEGAEDYAGTEVYAVATNGGIRFGFAPNDSEFASTSSEIGSSGLYLTAKEAMEEAESFVAAEAARDRGEI